MDPESTHHCGGGTKSVDLFSDTVPLFTACGATPGMRIATTLRNAVDIRDQVYANLAHYEDCAAPLAGSTDAMSAVPQCLHESANSSLFDIDQHARHLKRTHHLLRQAHVAEKMLAFAAEVRQA